MASVTTNQVVDIFKKVYGKANDLRPKGDIIDDLDQAIRRTQ
jgi:hypothetical protein